MKNNMEKLRTNKPETINRKRTLTKNTQTYKKVYQKKNQSQLTRYIYNAKIAKAKKVMYMNSKK